VGLGVSTRSGQVDKARYRAAEQALWSSVGASATERFLDLPRAGVRLRVQELGDGPPILFIHGGNTSGASWVTLAARLPGYRCLLLDRPGTGLSDAFKQRPTAAELMALGDSLVAEVLDAAGIGRAHVVATSFGGFLSLRSAAAHPDRVLRMVQFSWPVGAPTRTVPRSMRLMSVPGVARLASAMPATEGTVRAIFRSVGHGPSLDEGRITRLDIDAYLALLRYTDTLRNELVLSRSTVSPLRGFDPRLLPAALLASVRTPTRFIWGGQDPFGGPEIARAIVAMIPDAELELLPEAGHAPWLDEVDRCAASVGEFLGR
jgi:2-hydroxy-6-oxonona-2,4-dienedioate hydrolase